MGCWYDVSSNLFQTAFFFLIPVLLFLILFLMYQNFYAKDQKKPKFVVLYSKTMIWALSFLIIIMWAKIGDDMIDKSYMLKHDALNQEQNYYVDMYWCSQKFGIYDYQWWDSNLTKEQIEECRVEQLDRQKQYSKLDQNSRLYKSLYRVGFFALLLMIHIVLFYSFKNKKD
jgi:hypothetical protein